ncbi:erythromycin esterase [Actinoplanes sp. NBRC 101535]|nr:erythromycin esterase [Actinoplanes sp. NBRC 101535]
MAVLGRRPRVLALGEPTHGSDTLLGLRNTLFRDLVEQHGYRTITVESDCLAGLLVDAYVTTGAGDLDDVMARGFSHPDLGADAGNRDLVAWMREFNTGRPAGDQVRFAGFDGPLEMSAAASPRRALRGLTDDPEVEELIGDDARWEDPQIMWDPALAVGTTPAAQRLRVIADDLTARLDAEVAPLVEERMRARTAVGLLRYHAALADTSPRRFTGLIRVRSSMMAANLLALAERGPLLVHAHNSHVLRSPSSMRMGDELLEWWSAGALAGARLGADYAVLATALGTRHEHGVGEPPRDTLEGVLYQEATENVGVLAPATITAPVKRRESPWFGYAPLDPAQLDTCDGVVFVKDVR